ncbi:2'-5' RNA ligase family protein [Candidatus Pacearchaeota archaeon]|nr:2'-5' RNA ligase family protein [Candidatus Pacearchaeota archaeon]
MEIEHFFIALIPDEGMQKRILAEKKIVYKIAGDQKYLTHHPHSTLIVTSFEKNKVNEVLSIIKSIASLTPKISISLDHKNVFYDDALTEGHTFTYGFSKPDSDRLRELQLKVIARIKSLNKNILFNEQSEAYSKFSAEQKDNINKYGFPYIGKGWIPHITISSIDKNKFESVSREIGKNVGERFFFDSLALYRKSSLDSNIPVLVKSFPLTGKLYKA